MAKFCSLSEVDSLARSAVAGQTLVYFTAENLNRYDGLDMNLHRNCPQVLRRVVNAIRWLANDGKVDLVQARDGNSTEYRAIWRARARPLDPLLHFPLTF